MNFYDKSSWDNNLLKYLNLESDKQYYINHIVDILNYKFNDDKMNIKKNRLSFYKILLNKYRNEYNSNTYITYLITSYYNSINVTFYKYIHDIRLLAVKFFKKDYKKNKNILYLDHKEYGFKIESIII